MASSRKAEGRKVEEEEEEEEQGKEEVEEVQEVHHKCFCDEGGEKQNGEKAKEGKDAPEQARPWGNSGSGSSSFRLWGKIG